MATAELPIPTSDSAPHSAWRARIGAALAQSRVYIAQCAAEESGRRALWAPVAFGAGAASYLSLTFEPPAMAGLLAAGLFAGAAAFVAQVRTAALGALLFALGFLAADVRTARIDAPALARELPPRDITGRLLSVEEAPGQRRLILAVETIRGVLPEELPARVRVNWRGKGFDVAPGDMIALRAGLSPPPEPLAPGAFDFARQLYFQQVGATGFAVTAPVRVAAAPQTFDAGARARIERLRLAIARRIAEAAPGQGGAIVAAVVTGKREAISDEAAQALEDSSLAHLLAISGLHMGLATGLIFFGVRAALAAIPPLAERYPVKKWAAGAALLSGFFYLLLSGGGFSARRAFVMAAIMFVAILVDRRALSLRNVAVAAFVILATTPEAVLHPGFQMSFAAVTALIAGYEWHRAREDPDRSFSAFARVKRYAAGVAATDTISAFATAPYNLFHFSRSANLGLLANMIAIPAMGFWVMPAAILALALMPIGADAPAWKLAAAGVDAILAIGGWVAALPGAVTTLPKAPPAALVAITLGGLWLCLCRARWRLWGALALPVAAILVALHPAPAAFVAPDGDNVGIVLRAPAPGAVLLFNPRKDKFAATVWKEHVGLDALRAQTLPIKDAGRCDAAGCVVAIEGAIVSVLKDPLALEEDCARADLVLATFPVSQRKRSACAAPIVDRRDAWENGAHAIHVADGKIRIRAVGQARGARPWTERERG